MCQHALDDAVGALAVLDDLCEVAGQHVDDLVDLGAFVGIQRGNRRSCRVFELVEQFGRQRSKVIDEVQRVFDLVSDAGGELAQRRHFFGVDQARLRCFQLLVSGAQLALAPDLLSQGVAKPGEGSRHRADLVGSRSRDRNIDIPGVEAVHRGDQPAQGNRDRAQQEQSQKGAEQHGGSDEEVREARRRGGIGDDPLACCDRLAGQLGDDRGEQPIDRQTVLARLRQQRIPDHPAVVGVFVDGLGGQRLVLVELAANRRDALPVPRRQLAEVVLDPGAGGSGVSFRQCQLADREVGHPITLFAKRDLRFVGLFYTGEEARGLDHAGRILTQHAGQIRVGGDQNQEPDTRQQDKARPDRQPSHDIAPTVLQPPQW